MLLATTKAFWPCLDCKKQVLEGNRSLGDGYLDLVSDIGNASALAKISQEALQVVHDQAVAEKIKFRR
ncbi:MAG: hypothetical protein CM15mP51_05690 [Porticoccaceae bacterium]|nr:MAG: hypothetical protein CM15mP51_05690 [Porticoccaceae bacterium]